MKKPIVLCILDGFGIGKESDPSNAIARAKMPNYLEILTNYPNSKLDTSGLAVGLPEGQIGNSEVGHITIGAGRVIFQDLPRINNAIKTGGLAKYPVLLDFINNLKKSGKTCHLMGLLSDGGVHSHIDHIMFLASFLKQNGIKVALHAFLDGRDVAQKSAIQYLSLLDPEIIKTISGRYYAMDRDKKWDRIELATDAVLFAKGDKKKDYQSLIADSYDENITDEFVKPCVIGNYQGFEEGDGLIFANFRADRARQISEKIFELKPFIYAVSLTEYSEKLNQNYKVLFPSIEIKNSLPEILANQSLTQLRIAETEKYAHVTFFFSCGVEKELKGEKRILIESPKVATYDLKPEMSAKELGQKLNEAIKGKEFDFIVANYANPDMVGHSGELEPSIKACETIDYQLGMLKQSILAVDGMLIISADHGNVESLLDEDGNPHTAHTTNPVPFILIRNDIDQIKLSDGALSDIAPTILDLMNIDQPPEMTGQSLIKKI